MFTYERAVILSQLLESIILYEAVKNWRKDNPNDEDTVRRYDELRAEVEHHYKALLNDGFQAQA